MCAAPLTPHKGGDKPYLISGADDRLIKIWDYQNKSCVQTLDGHSHNVTTVCFHPELPLIISGSEDGASPPLRLENYGINTHYAYTFCTPSLRL